MSSISNLLSQINSLSNDFSNNIEGKYAKTHEESKLWSIDKAATDKVKQYQTTLESLVSQCNRCQTKSINYKYQSTTDDLSGISTSIKSNLSLCSQIPTNIKMASLRAFNDLYSEFKMSKNNYTSYLSDARQNLYRAKANKDLADANQADQDNYQNYTRRWQNYLGNARNRYNSAKAEYDKLFNLISTGGMGKEIVASGEEPSVSEVPDKLTRKILKLDGKTIEIRLDANGNLVFKYVTQENSDGTETKIITRYERDPNGNLILSKENIKWTGGTERVTTTKYDANGQVDSSTENTKWPDGKEKVTEMQYKRAPNGKLDSSTQNITWADGAKSEIKTQYDENGQADSSTENTKYPDGAKSEIKTQYDANGQVDSSTQNITWADGAKSGIKTQYDENGQVDSSTENTKWPDGKEKVTEMQYKRDPNGKLLSSTENVKWSDGKESETTTQYDENGQADSSIVNNKFPDGGEFKTTTQYKRDPNGKLLSSTENAEWPDGTERVTTTKYDADEKVDSSTVIIRYSDGNETNEQYGANGHKVSTTYTESITDSNGIQKNMQEKWKYDNNGFGTLSNSTETTTYPDRRILVQQYEYDEQGNKVLKNQFETRQ